MYTINIVSWLATWDSLITLVSSLILAAITAWLAWITKNMAASAKEAATQSRIAAQASLAAVAAAEASVDVRFEVEPSFSSTVDKVRKAIEIMQVGGMDPTDPVPAGLFEKVSAWTRVRLICRGATVTVHALKVTGIATVEPTQAGAEIRTYTSTGKDIKLTCLDELPRLCHANETIEFSVPDRAEDEGLVEFTAILSYSFGTGSVREREVKWQKPNERKLGSDKEGAERSVSTTG